MNTPTHILVAAALLTRRADDRAKASPLSRNKAVILGAILPDLSMFVFFPWAMIIAKGNQAMIWTQLYWQEPWQTFGAVSNSLPIMGMMLIVGIWRRSMLLTVLALAMMFHVGLDLPFHADDAHKHFWPFTDWRFASPLSYWDSDHGAQWVSLLEIVIVLICAIILHRRFSGVLIRLAIWSFPVLYGAMMIVRWAV